MDFEELLSMGVDEGRIFLDEYITNDRSLLEFSTIYDYDYAEYLSQLKAREEEFRDSGDFSEYYPMRFSLEARLLIGGKFLPVTLVSLASYVRDEVGAVAEDVIHRLVPHRYVPGKDHGKKTGFGYVWDMVIDADGQEDLLEELTARWYGYQKERWKELSRECERLDPAVYVREEDLEDDGRWIVFANEKTLKLIRWRHFVSDCNALLASCPVVDKWLSEETAHMRSWIEENYRDVKEMLDRSGEDGRT